MFDAEFVYGADAIFPMKEDTYIEAMWFIAWKQTDWMASVFREGDGPWRVTYRFRYYAGEDNDAWDGQDRKSVERFVAKDGSDLSRQQLRESVDQMSKIIATMQRAKRWLVVVQGNSERAGKLLAKQPWCHIKKVVVGPTRPQ